MAQREIEASFGDFRANVEGRLRKLESELDHRATKADLKTVQIWVLCGAISGLLMIAAALYTANTKTTTELMKVIAMLAETLKP